MGACSYPLAIPATAMPAHALVWVELVRTGAVPIPMISGLAQPVTTGIGLSGQQDSGRQDRRGGQPRPLLRTSQVVTKLRLEADIAPQSENL